MNSNLKATLNQYVYYVVIGLLSAIVVCVFPFLGSSINASIQLPTTTSGWVVWAFTKFAVCAINMLIFHSFIKQGKLNIKDNESYLRACELLRKKQKRTAKAPSPAAYHSRVYLTKGATLVITSFLSLMVFGEAILRLDYVALISYSITVVLGLIFGVLQMKEEECFWTTTYLQYAIEQTQEE